MFNHKIKWLPTLVALLIVHVPTYANEERTTSASLLKKIHVGMNMELALKILGAPNNDYCSGGYCAEWKLSNGKLLFIHGNSYIDTIQLKAPDKSSK